MTRRFRVVPSAALVPGDEPRDIDLDAVDPSGAGIGREPMVFVGPVRPSAAGGRATVEVVVDGWRFELDVEDHARAELRRRATREPDATAASGPTEIRAIIPGRIAAIRVAPGDVVEAGQGLLVVEAMKMQNELRAPVSGTVERVAVEEGQTIDNGDILVVVR
ncbi:MAG TPA: acetyl-CoA carboxylase biotin carboxyl carrier protein subunit [Candidatus Limnocylindrales bacterium]|nr:acetyl-CoA carboxylase biotin carboxyl carrier protein subunit [Candidatus Limnocylindrales bacterium]